MRRTPIKRGRPPKRTSRIARRTKVKTRNAKRRAANFDRAYGDKAAWIRLQSSCVSLERPCEAAHTRSGGMGRKADSRWLVPLTRREHRELHQHGKRAFQDKHVIDLDDTAAFFEGQWQALP